MSQRITVGCCIPLKNEGSGVALEKSDDSIFCRDNNKKKEYNVKSRYFAFVLYPDNELHVKYLYYLTHESMYDFVYILHKPHQTSDDDIRSPSDGVLDENVIRPDTKGKEHIHLVVDFGCARSYRSLMTIAHLYGVNHFEPLNNLDSMLIYLTHEDEKSRFEGKEVYPVSDVAHCNGWLWQHLQDIHTAIYNKTHVQERVNPVSKLYDIIRLNNRNLSNILLAVADDPELDKWVCKHQLLVREILYQNHVLNIESNHNRIETRKTAQTFSDNDFFKVRNIQPNLVNKLY